VVFLLGQEFPQSEGKQSAPGNAEFSRSFLRFLEEVSVKRNRGFYHGHVITSSRK